MSWLRRKPRSRFPADMKSRLERLGRFSLDSAGSGLDANEVYSTSLAPFRDDARTDPHGFLAELRALVAEDTGGFATYGACRMLFDLPGLEVTTEDYFQLLDNGIAFKRARGLPSASLTGYEWQRWLETNGTGTW